MNIRCETPADVAGIQQVHESAFGGAAEADLVNALRRDGDATLSLVATDGDVLGHILFSRLAAESGDVRAVALAPLAVSPAHQRNGIGAALVRAALAMLKSDGEDLVLVLGDNRYYARFGFSAEATRAFRTPYDGPHLQALALTDAGRNAGGVLRYAPAFARLG